jgi:DNA-binding CsgD family transcriptional regulator
MLKRLSKEAVHEAEVNRLIQLDREKRGTRIQNEEYPAYAMDSLRRMSDRNGEVSIETLFESEQLKFRQDDEMVKRHQATLWARKFGVVLKAIQDADLSDTQFAVASRKAFGETEEDIAQELNLKQPTVHYHWQNACTILAPALDLSDEMAILDVLMEVFGGYAVALAGY